MTFTDAEKYTLHIRRLQTPNSECSVGVVVVALCKAAAFHVFNQASTSPLLSESFSFGKHVCDLTQLQTKSSHIMPKESLYVARVREELIMSSKLKRKLHRELFVLSLKKVIC